jgi:hypothetical protein
MMATVVNQEEANRDIPKLLTLPARVRGLSCEPLLGPIDLRNLTVPRRYGTALLDALTCDLKTHHQEVFAGPPAGTGPITWVIIGGESGRQARPLFVEWIRDIARQCREASVPYFVKQLGRQINWHGGSGPDEHWPEGAREDVVLRAPLPREDTGHGFWRVTLHDTKGGDIAEWPDDLKVRNFPEVV